MTNWRDVILGELLPGINRLTIVADPDALLTEEQLAIELHKRGFELLEFRDSIEFRYAYESKYRSIWDNGYDVNLIVITGLHKSQLNSLPFDLLRIGRQLSFSLGEIFPTLNHTVLKQLARSQLDSVFDSCQEIRTEHLGENSTKDFVLRQVFGIDPGLISDDVGLLRNLLRIHYGNLHLPTVLKERLIQLLGDNSEFYGWPIADIIARQDAFFSFLQERWPIYLRKLLKVNSADSQSNSDSTLRYVGPENIPFDHDDIKVYIDNLFIEGKLDPIEVGEPEHFKNDWAMCGIIAPNENASELRISRLFELIKSQTPQMSARFSDWTTFALKWAELSSIVHCSNQVTHSDSLKQAGMTINSVFKSWLEKHYSGLINMPPSNPAMVHHIARRIARDSESIAETRIALLVVDGLSLDQWVTVRHHLQQKSPSLQMLESATFAWIPTITSVSRQSIFAGKAPIYFPASIGSTHAEEKLWVQFWEGMGLTRSDVIYCRGFGDGDASKILAEKIHPEKTKAIGIVIDKVDLIMHGMQMGSKGMHNQIALWCQSGFLSSLVELLLDFGYKVWLTADHGNIECNGSGSPSEKSIADVRGERARIYPSPELRSQISNKFSFSHEWDIFGLPPNYFPLLANDYHAFVPKGESIVGHGGASIEEVIVPLVKFERGSK